MQVPERAMPVAVLEFLAGVEGQRDDDGGEDDDEAKRGFWVYKKHSRLTRANFISRSSSLTPFQHFASHLVGQQITSSWRGAKF